MSGALFSLEAGLLAPQAEALLQRTKVLAEAMERSTSIAPELKARVRTAVDELRRATHELALLELDAKAVGR